jgi:hypothetical protein
MKGWLISNPKKRKTKAGIMRFVTNWLSREQDKGRASPHSERASYERPIGNYNHLAIDPFKDTETERPTENYDHLAEDLFADGTG